MSGKSSQQKRRTNHAVMLYMQELGARVVAQSGIPNDRFHLGKLTLQALKDNPNHVLQIDAGTDASETSGSILKRSVRCAIALQNLGLRSGDVMILMAPNHLDLCIPFYAAFYLGILISAIDTGSSVNELNSAFKNIQPSIVFCQNYRSVDVETALKESQTNAYVITFDKGLQFRCFSNLLEDISSVQIKYFRSTDFDSEQAIAFLTMTSGTTGVPKAAALTHKNLALGLPLLSSRYFNFPKPTHVDLCVSPLQWITAGIKFVMSPILRYTRLQTSAPVSNKHICDIINKYKPTSTLMSPHLIIPLVRVSEGERCDFSSLEVIALTGSVVTQAVVKSVKRAAPNADVQIVYGMSETSTLALAWDDDVATGSVGRPIGYLQYRIVDVSSLEDISEPYVTGELWMKGPTIFKGYYKNAETTNDAFSDDGWFKSGDLFYKDEYRNFFFVDRLKALLKFRSHQISPAELEHVIRRHPGVADVVVVGVPDEKDGDLPTAIVVPQQSANITAEDIKDLVKESMSDSKHLRGGVVFMKELPLTGTTKVNRAKLKKMITEMERQ